MNDLGHLDTCRDDMPVMDCVDLGYGHNIHSVTLLLVLFAISKRVLRSTEFAFLT